MKTSKLTSILALMVLICVPWSEFLTGVVQTGEEMYISLSSNDRVLGPGDDTNVRIRLFTGSGISASGVSGQWVNVSTEPDRSSPVSLITDEDGYCNLNYEAPSSINASFDVVVSAWIGDGFENGTNGTLTLHVVFRYDVQIIGPSMVLRGSEPVAFNISVTVNGEPSPFSTLGARSELLGMIVDYTITDSVNGKGRITYQPPDEIGRARLWVSAQGSGYGSERFEIGETYFDFMIVDEIAPFNITVQPDNMNCKRWGSLNLTVTATRGGHPAAGIRIAWSVTRGWLSDTVTYTDQNGLSTVNYTATHSDDSIWDGRINVTTTASDGMETKIADCWFNVWSHLPEWNTRFSYHTFGLQLVQGEDLFLQYSFSRWGCDLWNFIAGARLDFVIYDENMNEYSRETLLEGINIDSPRFYLESEKVKVMNIHVDMPPGQYFWELMVLSPGGVHTYWHPVPRYKELLVLDKEDKNWTFMIYINGDNNLGILAANLIEDLETRAPDGEFRVIIQIDHPWNTMERYELKGNGDINNIDSTLIYQHQGEFYNSGLALNLYQFMTWSADYAPAEHYCLVLWDHGGGFWGCSIDESHQEYNHFNLDDLNEKLTIFKDKKRILEVLVFDMCLMSCFEVVAQLQDCVGYMVAAENIVNAVTVEGNVFQHILDFYPDYIPSAIQVANAFVSGFQDSFGNAFPFTVIDLEKAGDAVERFDDLWQLLLDNWDHLKHVLTLTRSFMNYIEGPFLDVHWLVDLKDLIKELKFNLRYFHGMSGYQEMMNASEEFLRTFDDLIVTRLTVSGFNGINIFHPPSYSVYNSAGYDYWRHSLPHESNYHTVLEWYYRGRPAEEKDPEEEQGPPENRTSFNPVSIDNITFVDTDFDGQLESMDLRVRIDNRNGTEDLFLKMESFPVGDERSGMSIEPDYADITAVSSGNLNLNRYNIRSIKKGPHRIILKVLSSSGHLLHRIDLGNLTMNSTIEKNDIPDLEINVSKTSIISGDEIEFYVNMKGSVSDLNFWWDLDTDDGQCIDAAGSSITQIFSRPGNYTVRLFGCNGEITITRSVNITVEGSGINSPPVIGEVVVEEGPGQCGIVARIDSGTEDPDGDRIRFLFDFGEGSDCSWTDSKSAMHRFETSGEHSCAVWAMDVKGAISEPYFITTTSNGTLENEAPSLELSHELDEDGEVTVSLEGSYDPEGTRIETMIDWGDGNYTPYSDGIKLSHLFQVPGNHSIQIFIRDEDQRINSTTLFLKIDLSENDSSENLDHWKYITIAIVLIFIALLLLLLFLFISKRNKPLLEE
jgi:hypothetical protein